MGRTLSSCRNPERRALAESWLDRGYGTCALRAPSLATVVQSALIFFEENPVKAGLVARPPDWPWASASLKS